MFVFRYTPDGSGFELANTVVKKYFNLLKVPLTVEAAVDSFDGSDNKSVDFLDFTVTRMSDRFVISPFDKPTNLHLFIPPGSNHPLHVGLAWIRAFLQRLARNSSNFDVFSDTAVRFFDDLRARGYSAKVLFEIFGSFNYSIERPNIFNKFNSSLRTYEQLVSPTARPPITRFFVPIPYGKGTNAVKWTKLLNKARRDHLDDLQYVTNNYPSFGTAWTTLPSLATIIVTTLQSSFSGNSNPNPNPG